MNQEERIAQIKKESEELIPKGLDDKEQGVWRMCFNMLRQADLASDTQNGKELTAIWATIQTVLKDSCAPLSDPIFDRGKQVVAITCSNKGIDMDGLLKTKSSLFPNWDISVNNKQGPNGWHAKIVFLKKHL